MPCRRPRVRTPDIVRIDVLSNRADLISGGDALVAVAIPAERAASAMRVTVGSAM